MLLGLIVGLAGSGCSLLGDDDDSADDDDTVDDDDDSTADDDDTVDDDDSVAGACAPATTIQCGATLDGSTEGGPSAFDLFDCAAFGTLGPEAFFEFTSTLTGPVRVGMTPDAEDLDLFVLATPGGECDPDDCLAASQQFGAESVAFNAVEGETYTIVVDGYGEIPDTFSISLDCDPSPPVDYLYVAVRSRTASQADVDNNTPGPDLDAIEIYDGTGSEWAAEVWSTPGDLGAGGSVNEDPGTVLFESDAFEETPAGGMDCNLDDDTGYPAFYSVGGGDPSLGSEGWVIAAFDEDVVIDFGSVVGVYEVGAADCDNITAARDDEYEVILCQDGVDPEFATILDLEGDLCLSLGETGAGGGVFDFYVPL